MTLHDTASILVIHLALHMDGGGYGGYGGGGFSSGDVSRNTSITDTFTAADTAAAAAAADADDEDAAPGTQPGSSEDPEIQAAIRASMGSGRFMGTIQQCSPIATPSTTW